MSDCKTCVPTVEARQESQTETPILRRDNRMVLGKLKEECPDFVRWFGSLSRWGGNLVDACVLSRPEAGRYRIQFFTKEHRFCIAIHLPGESYDGYLGCTASLRKPLAGEDWDRGSDLRDGPYSEETWRGILADIVAYEMVRLGK